MENYTKRVMRNALMGEIVFLMLAMPLGIVYFTIVVTAFSLGVGTLVIWIGLPILFATLYVVHGMAAVERNLVRNLLNQPHPDLPYGREPARGFLRRFGSMLRDPYTWTGLLYMLFIKLPLGIISFTLTVTFLVISASLTLLPLVYLINLFIDYILIRSGVPSAQSIIIPYFLEINGGFDPLMFIRSFAGVPLGLVFWYLTRLLIKGMASFSGVLANAMLGPGTSAYVMQPHTQTTEQRVYTGQPQMQATEQRVYTGQPQMRVAEQRAYND